MQKKQKEVEDDVDAEAASLLRQLSCEPQRNGRCNKSRILCKNGSQSGATLLTNVDIKKYLENNAKQAYTSKIATATEILEFLTDTVRNKDNGLKDRLKAARKF